MIIRNNHFPGTIRERSDIVPCLQPKTLLEEIEEFLERNGMRKREFTDRLGLPRNYLHALHYVKCSHKEQMIRDFMGEWENA